MRVQQGTVIGERFRVIEEIRSDDVYQWVQAEDSVNSSRVVLQILVSLVSSAQLMALTTYFDTVNAINSLVPVKRGQKLGDAVFPFVLKYALVDSLTLNTALKSDPAKAQDWIHEAAERIYELHTKNLIHGHICDTCFSVEQGQVYLTGLGYGPLLVERHPDALKTLGATPAPEILAGGPPTIASDIFDFGKLIETLEPRLRNSAWMRQATASNPSARFPRMREARERLEEALQALEGADESEAEAPLPEEIPDSHQEPRTIGGIVPVGNPRSVETIRKPVDWPQILVVASLACVLALGMSFLFRPSRQHTASRSGASHVLPGLSIGELEKANQLEAERLAQEARQRKAERLAQKAKQTLSDFESELKKENNDSRGMHKIADDWKQRLYENSNRCRDALKLDTHNDTAHIGLVISQAYVGDLAGARRSLEEARQQYDARSDHTPELNEKYALAEKSVHSGEAALRNPH